MPNAGDRDKARAMIVVCLLLTHYVSPSQELLPYFLHWTRTVLMKERAQEKLAFNISCGLKLPKVHEYTGRAFYDWPPSMQEIDAAWKNKKVEVHVQWPLGDI